MTDVGIYANIIGMGKDTRAISWIKAALKEFQKFPQGARNKMLTALTIAAEGSKSDIAKPLKGMGSGIFEIALEYSSNAYRAVYTVKISDDIWVVHAFQKKSSKGIKTPKKEIDLVRERIRLLKEQLK